MKRHKPDTITKQEERKRAALIALYAWERNSSKLLRDGELIDKARYHHRRMIECDDKIEQESHEAQLGACIDLLAERGYIFR